MRVLLSTIGSRGDVQPLVALAAELKTLGHDVRLCVPPDFREWIEGLGMPVTSIGPSKRTISVPGRAGWRRSSSIRSRIVASRPCSTGEAPKILIRVSKRSVGGRVRPVK